MLGPIRPLVTLTVIFMCSQLSSANQPSKHAKRDVVYGMEVLYNVVQMTMRLWILMFSFWL